MTNPHTYSYRLGKAALLGGALLSLASASSVSAALIAYYDFEDNILDSSGNDYDGVLDGGGSAVYSTDRASAISSRSTKSYSLADASNNYITLPDNDIDFYGMSQASSGVTISMWVKASAQNAHYLFSVRSTSDSNPIYGVQGDPTTNSKLRRFYRDNGGTITAPTSTTAPLDNTWFHFAMTDVQGDVTVYIDGVADSTNFDYTPGTFSHNLMTLGALPGSADGFPLDGLMDEVAIYDTVLTQTEVAALAGGANPIPEPSSSVLLGFAGLMTIIYRRRK